MVDMEIQLSVITICYNIKEEIERTCQSIVAQTTHDFEWVVIDGGSTDGTLDILNKYKDHIDIFVSEPDKGIYNAMNKGIRLAHGEWLNFMNGGDEFADKSVIADFLAFDGHDADIVYGNCNVLEANGFIRLQQYSDISDKTFFCTDCIGHQASFIRRVLFDQYGLYNEKYRIVSDWEKWIIFAENNCNFQHWDRVVSIYHHYGVSSTMSKRHHSERQEVINAHYTKEEIANSIKNVWSYKYLIGNKIIPLLTLKAKKNGNQWRLYLFGVIPLYRINKKNGIAKHYLFGFVPLFKLKEK